MGDKPKISLVWVVALSLGFLLGVILLIQTQVVRQVPLDTSLPPEGSGIAPVSQETKSSLRSDQAGSPITGSNRLPRNISPEAVASRGVPATSISKGSVEAPAASPVSAMSAQSQAEQQEVQPVLPVPVNAPLSDEQILEQVRQQDRSVQALQRNTAARDAQAAQVLRNIAAGINQPAGTQEVMSSDSPRPTPPAEIVQKIKSHQLTAH